MSGFESSNLFPIEESKNELGILPSIHPNREPNAELRSNINDRLQYLSSVFPDANPFYLKTMALKNYESPDTLEKFVAEKLDTRDYPTKENYFPVKNKTRIQGEDYVDSFSAEDFLKSVPDPINVYENPERKCTYDVVVFELLKNHFNRLKVIFYI